MSHLSSLGGKVAFVTGGSSGIGLGIARACLEEGMKVAITYLTAEHLQHARHALGQEVLAFCLDVRDRAAMARVAESIEKELGPVQLLVNNAGVGIKATVGQASAEDWDYALDVNLRGVIHGVSEFVPRMLAARQPAHIVSTASMSGLMVSGRAGVYATTKFAVVGMMEALRAELAPQGIGVSAFCPGVVQSRIAAWNRHLPQRTIPAELPQPMGMDPLECGRRVLRGVKENALFILTHPEFREGLEERCRVLLSSFQSEEAPPDERVTLELPLLRSEVYGQEMRRLGLEGSGDSRQQL